MSEDTKPDIKPETSAENQINLKVQGSNGNVVHFKLRKNTALKKLMTAYCEREGLRPGAIRFVFDGTNILETHTPNDLDMEDDDTIEVYQQQTGGHFKGKLQ